MKDIYIIQHNYTSTNSVFCFSNVFSKNYLDQLLEKTIELTKKDVMNKSTNVIANMTHYKELLNHKIYTEFFSTTIELVNFCYRLRTPHANQKLIFDIIDAWGLQHFKDDYTKVHTHEPCKFSTAFCLRNPDSNTEMFFDDFGRGVRMIENQLIIFPSSIKHSVNSHNHPTISRVSLATNIEIKVPEEKK